MPKNPGLEYAPAQPSFLRRLKAGNAALGGRHNVQIPRARGNAGRGGRLDMDGVEGEDDPVMIDEEGNVVTKEEFEGREKEKSGEEDGSAGNGGEVEEETQVGEEREHRVKDGVSVSSGFGRKRKAVKVVGDDDQAETLNEQDDEDEPAKSLKDSTKDLKDAVAQQKDDAKKEAAAVPTTKKGKRKKLKLSFEELE